MTIGQLAQLTAEAEWRLGLRFDGSRRPAMLASIECLGSGQGPESDREHRDGWLADGLTVAESYFFRDARQIRFLTGEVIPEVLGRHGADHRLRVWSAGCAGGEEPYTVAMVLFELGLRSASIVGTDVAPGALRRAAVGVYSPWALRAVDDRHRRRWFLPVGGGLAVAPDIRGAVRFQHLNLVEPTGSIPRNCDIVLCRNVLVYLTPSGLERAVRTLSSALAPGGWLLTAPTDPPLETPHLERALTPTGVAYRLRHRGARPLTPSSDGGRRATATQDPPPRSRLRPPQPPRRRAPLTLQAVPTPRHPRRPAAEAARALGDAGALVEALETLAAAVEVDPLDAGLRHLQAVLHLENGNAAAAAAAAAAAVYLQPDLAVAHLMLAHARKASGDDTLARRSFATGLRLLEAMPPEGPVPFGDGHVAGTLAVSVRHGARFGR